MNGVRRSRFREAPPGTKPRERLSAYGIESLSDTEILAILLRTGKRGQTVMEFSQELLENHGGLQGLFRKSLEEFRRIPGVGLSKGATLLASFDLPRRLAGAVVESTDLSRPEAVAEYLQPKVRLWTTERFGLLCLHAKNHLIKDCELFRGGLDGGSIDLRVILKETLLNGSVSTIVYHNHPSGETQPSREDREVTKRLRNAFEQIGIAFLDHLIVAANNFYSFRREDASLFKFEP